MIDENNYQKQSLLGKKSEPKELQHNWNQPTKKCTKSVVINSETVTPAKSISIESSVTPNKEPEKPKLTKTEILGAKFLG